MRSLFLIRTPFQAWIALKIIEQERIRAYDVLYISRNRNRKDEHYYRRLAAQARRGCFFKHLDVQGRLGGYAKALAGFPWWLIRERYGRAYLASFNLWYFRAIIARCQEIRTFDDGAGNYFDGGRGLFALAGARDRRVGAWFGGMPVEEVPRQAERHYALRPDLPNIVPAERVSPIRIAGACQAGQGPPSAIAIGQPFGDYLSPESERRVRDYMAQCGGVYFPHPREPDPPPGAVDSDLVLEEFVERQPGPVRLIGGFSTAFFTCRAAEKLYLDADGDPRRRALMESAGCETVRLA